MTGKRVVARNVVWNWAGMVVPMLAGFIVAPFLVNRLGDTVYGLWVLIASLTSYFGLLDLGIRGSVGRNIAYYRTREGSEGASAILSTAVAILCVPGVIALAATFVLQFVFFQIFDVPADEVASCRLALILVGINLAVTLPLSVFDATLWAFQRFDLLNAVDIPIVIGRTALTFYLIGQGHGLAALAWLMLLTTLLGAVFKAWLNFRIEPALRIAVGHVQWRAFHSLCSYGIWLFILSVTRLISSQVNPVIIGARLAPALVTPYSIATRLVGYAVSLVVSCTGVLAPVATTLHAQGSNQAQRSMFIRGGTYCSLIAFFFLTLFILLGQPFIRLWMGPSQEQAWLLLVILALGETLPLSQAVSGFTVLGIGRHRFLAWVSVLECGLAVGGTFLLLDRFGLPGACLAVAVPGAVIRGVVQMVYACRVVEIPCGTFTYQALLRPFLSALPPALLLGLATYYHRPGNWFQLVVYGAVYGFVYVVTWFAVFEPDRVKALKARFVDAKVGVAETCLEATKT